LDAQNGASNTWLSVPTVNNQYVELAPNPGNSYNAVEPSPGNTWTTVAA